VLRHKVIVIFITPTITVFLIIQEINNKITAIFIVHLIIIFRISHNNNNNKKKEGFLIMYAIKHLQLNQNWLRVVGMEGFIIINLMAIIINFKIIQEEISMKLEVCKIT